MTNIRRLDILSYDVFPCYFSIFQVQNLRLREYPHILEGLYCRKGGCLDWFEGFKGRDSRQLRFLWRCQCSGFMF